MSSAVATAHLIARPTTPDQYAAPVAAVVLTAALGFVLIHSRRAVPQSRHQGRSPSGRAPPGPIAHR